MVPALVQGGIGLLQSGIGIAQKIKAAKLAKRNVRPELEDNAYIDDMYTLTASQAGQGLSDATKQSFLTNIDRNVSSGIDAVLRGGGSVNNIGDLIDSGNSAVREMAWADQQVRARNTSQFITAIQAKADEDRDQFFLNELAPFQDRAQMISELSKQGMDNIFKGVNTMGSAAIGAFGDPYKNETEGLTNRSQSQAQSYSPNIRTQPLTVSTVPMLNDYSTEALLNRYRR
jgi:hypothetical protein